MNNTHQPESTTVYLGNTRTLSNASILGYCSKFGLVLDCSRRLLSSEQAHLVDFTFVRFLNAQSYAKFLSTSSHILDNGITLDVRPFHEILHPAVPLSVDRKMCIVNLPSHLSLNEIKKYLRAFGAIKQASSETDSNEQRHVCIEFESAASRNKLLKGKIRHHRIRDQVLDILPLLRPTDVDLQKVDEQSSDMDDSNAVIHLEREYNLRIRQQFDSIENQISELINEKRQNYAQLRKMIEMQPTSSPSTTIYVGNIQSIKDDQLRDYFQRFGRIEAFYHNCTRAADEWLIDYRFIRFSPGTDMSVFLTNKIDHIISRIRLDIHPYQAAFADSTRLMLDRKICIAHTDPKLDRNVVKKAFVKYGRILNCTCVSSGNGVEYVYIEFDSINSVASVCASKQRHFAGKTSLAVRQPFRPSQVGAKMECITVTVKEAREPAMTSSAPWQKRNSSVDTAQYSSVSVHRHNSIIEDELRASTPVSDQLSHSSQRALLSSPSTFSNHSLAKTSHESPHPCSPQRLKDFEQEYGLIIRQDLDEITYQTETFLVNQKQSYKKIRRHILDELRSPSSSPSNEEGEIGSSSSDAENSQSCSRKRPKGHH